MVFIAFTFLSSTTWQVTAALSWQSIVTVLLFFLGLSLAFLIGRLVPEIRRLVGSDRPWDETLDVGRRHARRAARAARARRASTSRAAALA